MSLSELNRDPAFQAKQRAGRLAKNGGQYLSDEQRQKQSARAKRRAQTRCKRGHLLPSTSGRRNCAICQAMRRRAWIAKHRRPGLIPAGVSPSVLGLGIAWAVRRDKYGPSGLSARGKAVLAANLPPGGVPHRGIRKLRPSRQRSGRPRVIVFKGCRIDIAVHDAYYWTRHDGLKAAMLAAHPDKGGTSTRFINAQRAYASFKDEERTWYAELGLSLPRRESQRKRAA